MSEREPIKVKGIVTRAVQYKENDKILTVLTADMGLISVYCYGVKSNKSKLLTPTRLFCYSEFILVKKKDYYYVKEADYIEAFFDIVNSVDKLFLGQYFLEVINEVCVEGERQDGFLRLLLNSLYALSADLYPPLKIKSPFELRACVEMGLCPNTSGCRRCRTKKDGRLYFDVLNGNVVCGDCLLNENTEEAYADSGMSSGSYIPITPSVIGAMEYVSASGVERLFSFSLTDDAYRSFAAVCEKYLLNQVGRSFVTLELYNQQIKQ